MIGFKTFFFFQRNKINKNNGRNHITKHLFFLEELLCFLGLWAGLDDRDKEGEAEWLLDPPEYAYEVEVEVVGGDWFWIDALTPAMGEW